MEKHLTILGILFIIIHLMAFFIGLVILVTFIGVGIVSSTFINGIHIFPWMPLGGLFQLGWILGGGMLLLSLPGIITGLGLTRLKSWARPVGIVIALFHLINIPLGTLFAIYALWVLLSKESAEVMVG